MGGGVIPVPNEKKKMNKIKHSSKIISAFTDIL